MGAKPQKGQNGQGQDQWVDRTHFVSVKVDHRFIQSIKGQISKGDQISIQGKLVQEKWEDKQTRQKRSEMRIKAQKVVGHITKQELECLKSAGLRGSNQGQHNSAPQQGGFNQNQQGGFNSQQNSAPQQGSFNQNQHGGYQQNSAPQQGGYQ